MLSCNALQMFPCSLLMLGHLHGSTVIRVTCTTGRHHDKRPRLSPPTPCSFGADRIAAARAAISDVRRSKDEDIN
eukprot:scaffold55196_cov14-Tisochrysis_lutea.AAC.1